MKNNSTFIFITVLCATASTLSAQTSATPVGKTGNEWHAAGNAIPRSKAFADRLTLDLSLTDDISKKVLGIFLINTKSVDEIKIKNESDAVRKEELSANREAFDGKIKVLLTPEQFQQYVRLPYLQKITE